jgi:hypothetical protein
MFQLNFVFTFQNLCKRPPNPFPGCRRVDKEEFRHNLSILNLYTNGRLGNQMSTFATLYAYTRLLRLRPVLYKDQLDSLSFYFPKVAEVAPAIEDVYCDPCEMPWEKFDLFLKSPPKEKTYEQGRAFGMTSYHQNPAAYKKYLPDMKTFLFRIEDRFTNEALAKLGVAAGVPVIGNTDLVLVGVHVRRTDYVGSVRKHEGNLATARYFGKAMDYFRNKYKKGKGTRRKLMFVVVSDDMEWCRKNIVGDDVAMLGNHMGSGAASTEEQAESLGVDLGLMLQCHHAIISHGTLGMWIGMLVGGETVMADDANMREPLEEVTLIRRANLGWKFMDYS